MIFLHTFLLIVFLLLFNGSIFFLLLILLTFIIIANHLKIVKITKTISYKIIHNYFNLIMYTFQWPGLRIRISNQYTIQSLTYSVVHNIQA